MKPEPSDHSTNSRPRAWQPGGDTAITRLRRSLPFGTISMIGLLGLLLPASAQPLFYLQPTNTIVTPGATAKFAAGATSTNPPITYQWWFKDVAVDVGANPSAGTRVLSISIVAPANAGAYFLVASDLGGAATSQVATLSVDLRSQGCWQRLSPGLGASWPQARGYADMVYDPTSGHVLLVGGEAGWFGDWASHLPGNGGVWALDPVSAQWSLLCNTNPAGDGTVYDTKAGWLISYVSFRPNGSATPNFVSETWAFDPVTGTWENRQPACSPPPGLLGGGAQMACNSKWDKIIRFGGLDLVTMRETSSTWVYDYALNTWTNMTPKASPPGRNSNALIYHEAADRVILFGGGDANVDYNDTWAYDFEHNTWTLLKPATRPSARCYGYLAYSSAQGSIVLFGGVNYTETQINNETWLYNYWANTWTRFTPPVSPNPRGWYAVSYAAAADAVVLFGGGLDRNHFTNEAWSYRLPLRATVVKQAGQVILNWNGGVPPYSVQSTISLDDGDWQDILTNASPPVTLLLHQTKAFYRIVGQ